MDRTQEQRMERNQGFPAVGESFGEEQFETIEGSVCVVRGECEARLSVEGRQGLNIIYTLTCFAGTMAREWMHER